MLFPPSVCEIPMPSKLKLKTEERIKNNLFELFERLVKYNWPAWVLIVNLFYTISLYRPLNYDKILYCCN